MIRHIIAIDAARGMVKDGRLPWSIPEDGKYFRDMTANYGGNVLMGSKTLAAMQYPMANRHNFIVTHQTGLHVEGALIVHDLRGFIEGFTDDLWIIGGAEIYAQTMDLVDELYITEIEADFGCDAFYPEYKKDFILANRTEQRSYNDLRYRYSIYRRK